MPTEFKLPELGENVTAGDVVRILVKAGDAVTKDQPILELETDKATIEVPSSVSGTVQDVKIKIGDKVKVGQVILIVDGNGARAEYLGSILNLVVKSGGDQDLGQQRIGIKSDGGQEVVQVAGAIGRAVLGGINVGGKIGGICGSSEESGGAGETEGE